MTVDRVVVRKDTYFDSISLMLVSRQAADTPGVDLATALLTTPLNRGMLELQGFDLPADLGPNDLVLALRGEDGPLLDRALKVIEGSLAGARDIPSGPLRDVSSWRQVRRREPSPSLGIVAVPGRYAAAECAAALEAGLDVFCFSDGVPINQEVALKDWAISRGLLFMGPDCGTAIIGGAGLGFANRVRPGPVGIVGASGTGTQELCALLDRSDVGISHAVGVGSRDLSSAVGGRMTFEALDRLGRDAQTKVVTVVSKPSDGTVASRLIEHASSIGKPVVLALMGGVAGLKPSHGVTVTSSLEEAAGAVGRFLEIEVERPGDANVPATAGYVRGFFSGGTLCYQVQSVLLEAGIKIRSNVPLDPALELQDPWQSEGNTLLDLGDDVFTDGRLHPMIDPSLRDLRLKQEANDAEVGLIVCDVVLGDGVHPDPAIELAQYIAEAKSARGDDLQVIVCVCGTATDPQGLERQRDILIESGAVVVTSSEAAARAVVSAMRPAS
jgi:FdrA protein